MGISIKAFSNIFVVSLQIFCSVVTSSFAVFEINNLLFKYDIKSQTIQRKIMFRHPLVVSQI